MKIITDIRFAFGENLFRILPNYNPLNEFSISYGLIFICKTSMNIFN